MLCKRESIYLILSSLPPVGQLCDLFLGGPPPQLEKVTNDGCPAHAETQPDGVSIDSFLLELS